MPIARSFTIHSGTITETGTTTAVAAPRIRPGEALTLDVASIGGTDTPTFTVVVQTSDDGTNWVELEAFDAQTANGHVLSLARTIATPGTSTATTLNWTRPDALAWLRLSITVTGTDPTATITVKYISQIYT